MDDIARHLSVSKKTLYQNFQDKDEMVLLATKAYLEMEMEKYIEVEKNARNAIEELVGVNSCIRRDFKETNPSLLFDLEKYHPRAWQEWLNFKYGYVREFLSNNLIKGKKEGYFRDDIDIDLLAIMRVEQVQMAFNEKIFSGKDYDIQEIQVKFFDHFVHGILTDKGRRLYNEYLEKQETSKI